MYTYFIYVRWSRQALQHEIRQWASIRRPGPMDIYMNVHINIRRLTLTPGGLV